MVRIRALVFLLGFVELDGRLEGGREGGVGGVEWSGVMLRLGGGDLFVGRGFRKGGSFC